MASRFLSKNIRMLHAAYSICLRFSNYIGAKNSRCYYVFEKIVLEFRPILKQMIKCPAKLIQRKGYVRFNFERRMFHCYRFFFNMPTFQSCDLCGNLRIFFHFFLCAQKIFVHFRIPLKFSFFRPYTIST